MIARKTKTEPTKSAFDFVDLITGRIGKITGLVVAIGGLAVGALTQSEQILNKLTALGLYTPPPCAQVDPLIIPATVKYSEWDNMKIKLKGRNNCLTSLGLYVTFVRRTASEPRYVLRVPHDDLPECKGLAPLQEPKCWDPKKPISIAKGDWEWDVLPPPLRQLSDPRRIEKISMTWAVYDFDAPTKPPIRVDTATIEVHNDAGNAS
jgi:hypothetical protein